MRRNLESGISADLERIADLAGEEMKKLIKEKMKVYGCAGRAQSRLESAKF